MGALVRILPGLYSSRPEDFADLAKEKELFFAFYPLKYALPEGETEVVSHQPIPDWAKSYPMMRHSSGRTWTILRADMQLTLENLKKTPKYAQLTPD